MINSQETPETGKALLQLRWLITKAAAMRAYLASVLLTLTFLSIPTGSTILSPVASPGWKAPTFKIVSVEQDQRVTIETYNFPADQVFKVTMGYMGTRGINGYYVVDQYSGTGGAFTAQYDIPAELQGEARIAIRLQTYDMYPYFSYNWFHNNSADMGTGGQEKLPGTPGYVGIPTFKIAGVVRDTSVTIETHNYPAGQTFNVTMGAYGARGIGGVAAGSFESGDGGTFTQVIEIPEELRGLDRIAIRAQTDHHRPYYSFNWFFNFDGNTPALPAPETQDNGQGGEPEAESPPETISQPPAPQPQPYVGIPTIMITAVQAGEWVEFETKNFPADQIFDVYMAPRGYRHGYGRHAMPILVDSFHSGDGGSFIVQVAIPPELAGLHQISIRTTTRHAHPYFSFNWFYNNTTP